MKNIEKYNIKMNNLKAKIDHYDQRAIDEVESRPSTSSTPKKQTTTSSSTSNDNDGFDF